MLTHEHRLSFGCSGLAGLFKPVTPEDADEVLSAAWDAGIRYFDTAPHYGNGTSERQVGDFLRSRENWILSTKVGRLMSPSENPLEQINGFHNPLPFDQRFDFSYDGIMRSVEASFHRLGLNRIDILYVHDIGDPSAGTNTAAHFADLLDSGSRALSELKAAGTVSAVGLGVNTVSICEQLIGKLEIDLILLAGRYTLLDQTAHPCLFSLCQQHDIHLVIGGVFNSGILATGTIEGALYDYAPACEDILDRVSKIEKICNSHGIPLATAALQFPSRSPLVASTLIGTAKASTLVRNVSAWSADLPKQLWADLKDEGIITE